MIKNPPLILVQEDAPQIARIIHFKLTSEGHRVDVTETGEESLRLLREEAHDLIVLDAEGPGLSGWDLLDQITRDPKGLKIPILFLLENEAKVRVAEAMKRGASDCLVKPFRPTQLAKKVKSLLDGSVTYPTRPQAGAADEGKTDILQGPESRSPEEPLPTEA